jgi:hypothetical protein
MADNITVTSGSGKIVLADEVTDGVLGTGISQFIKIMDGTLDGTAKAAVSDAYGLRVDVNRSASGSMATAVQGTVADHSTVANNPLLVGAKAVSNVPSAYSASDVATLITDLVGKLITLPYSVPENMVSGVTTAITGSSIATLIAAPAAGYRNYITHIIATNSSSAVGTFVNVTNGSNGANLYAGYAAKDGGGFSITFPTPLRQTESGSPLGVFCVTAGANVIVAASGYKGI